MGATSDNRTDDRSKAVGVLQWPAAAKPNMQTGRDEQSRTSIELGKTLQLHDLQTLGAVPPLKHEFGVNDVEQHTLWQSRQTTEPSTNQ